MRRSILKAASYVGAVALASLMMGSMNASATEESDHTVITPSSRVTDGSISAETQGYWPRPEGCGSYLVRFSGVTSEDIGSIDIVDASDGSTIASELFIFEDVSAGIFSTIV